MPDYEQYRVPPLLDDKKREEIYGPEIDPLLAQLFYNREITDSQEVQNFFEFDWSGIHDPMLFKDMDATVGRILDAIQNNQKILIYSDYDTDGIPGGAVMHDFFTKIGYENFLNYIPNRNTDGYGLNMDACKQFVKDKVDLLITVDCGITDNDEVAYLMKNNIDVIVTDHHLPEGDMPQSCAVIDHKRADNTYPEDVLCGCAIAWKVVCAVLAEGKRRGLPQFADIPDGWEKTLLDLVAISTICDMVPLTGENRLLVHFGKMILGITNRPGLHTIFKKGRLDHKKLTTDDIAFMIGPRINAASRLDDPMIAFKALAYRDAEATAAALELEKLNNRRKYATAKIMKEVWGKLEEREESPVIVIGNPEWQLGVLGLIAGKIADREKKPVFVWTRVGNEIKGSCRSGSDVSVFSLMQETRDMFVGFGGHAASGGFETDGEKIHFLQEKLSEQIDKADTVPKDTMHVDAELATDQITLKLYNTIHQLEPFGMGNAKPQFILHAELAHVRPFGKTGNHLELGFAQSNGRALKATSFYCDELLEKNFKAGEKVRAVVSVEKDSYGGNEYVALRLQDVL